MRFALRNRWYAVTPRLRRLGRTSWASLLGGLALVSLLTSMWLLAAFFAVVLALQVHNWRWDLSALQWRRSCSHTTSYERGWITKLYREGDLLRMKYRVENATILYDDGIETRDAAVEGEWAVSLTGDDATEVLMLFSNWHDDQTPLRVKTGIQRVRQDGITTIQMAFADGHTAIDMEVALPQ